MNKIIFFFTFLFCYSAFAQEMWRDFGPDDTNRPSFYEITYSEIAVDNNGVVYVAYSLSNPNISLDDKISVRKYINNHWEQVGIVGFSAGKASYISIDIDTNNVPYVAYIDDSIINRATVQKFNGTSWELVGNPTSLPAMSEYTDLAIDNNNTVHIISKEGGTSFQKAVVRKFNGTNWEIVGNTTASNNAAWYTKLAFSNDNTLFVAYADVTSNFKINVKKLNGTNWELVGTNTFSNIYSVGIDLAVDSFNLPYVIYTDNSNSYRTTIKKFNGAQWITLGISGETNTEFTKIAINSQNIPYITYYDDLNDIFVLKKYISNSWQNIVNVTFKGNRNTIAIDNQDKLYVSSSDEQQIVNKFDGINWELLGTNGITDNNEDEVYFAQNTDYEFFVAYSFKNQNQNRQIKFKKSINGNWIDFVTPSLPISGYLTGFEIDQNNIFYVDIYLSGTYKLTSIGWEQISSNQYGLSVSQQLVIDKNLNPNIYKATTISDVSNELNVYRYNSSNPNWIQVGLLPVQSDTYDSVALSAFISIDNNNTPYIAYYDYTGLTVKKFGINYWLTVGEEDFSLNVFGALDLKFDNNNVPYIVYNTINSSNSINQFNIKKFNGTNWETVDTNFSQHHLRGCKLLFDENNIPHIVYKEPYFPYFITVRKFVDNDWVLVGQSNLFEKLISTDDGDYNKLQFFFKNNVPIVFSNSTGVFGKYFGEENLLQTQNVSTNNEKNIIYPNPVGNHFSISSSLNINKIVINDLTGKIVLTKSENFDSIDVSQLKEGIYILKIINDKESKSIKIIKN